ncbi:MAG: prepilin-type N-terminal cleavage/methylation domain-containing protein [bacterium]
MRTVLVEEGFTLVEVVVAMFIFGILATGMTTLMGVLIQHNEFARAMTEATTLAENKMEEFKNMDYDSIVSGSDEPSARYSRSWTVEDDVPQAGMKQITVTVSWYDKKGRIHRMNLITLRSQ